MLLAVVAELGLLTELTTVLLPLGGALDEEEEEDRPPSTESSSSKFLSATTGAENRTIYQQLWFHFVQHDDGVRDISCQDQYIIIS